MSTDAAAGGWIFVGAAVAVVLLMLLFGGPTDVLPFIGAYFVLFDLGPLVSFLLGQKVYSGIVLSQVDRASWGFLLALIGMLVGGLLVRQRPAFDRDRLDADPRTYHLLPYLLLGLALYALGTVAVHASDLFVGPKLVRIEAAGPLHYQFLLVEYCASALYFAAMRTRLSRLAYWLNLGSYVLYCVATAERDFLFVVFALLLYARLCRRRKHPAAQVPAQRVPIAQLSGRWPPAAGQLARRHATLRTMIWTLAGSVAILYTASSMASARGGSASGDGGGLLKQGSVLFVDTYVMHLVPAIIPFRGGATYVDAVAGLLSQRPWLSTWLVDLYAPGYRGGYGFSLVAEAYLNFGMLGIPVFFGTLTVLLRVLLNRLDRGQFSAYASVLFTAAVMYNFRGESAALLKMVVDGLLLFAVLHLTSSRPRRSPGSTGSPGSLGSPDSPSAVRPAGTVLPGKGRTS